MGKTRVKVAGTGKMNGLDSVMESFRWLLMRPTGTGMVFRDTCHLKRLQVLYRAMQLLDGDVKSEGKGELVACMEIVLDYLHKEMRLSDEHQRLAQIMVADYVNEYVQHLMPELSPRTLIRYLELVEADPDRRRRLMEESLVDPIRKPTVDMFMESNKRLIDEMNVGRERYAWRPQDLYE